MNQGTKTTRLVSAAGSLMSLFTGLAFAAVLTWTSPARAQNNGARRFHPVPSPNGILGEHTTKGMGRDRLFTSMTLDYANDELVLRRGGLVTDKPIAHRLVAELGLTLGLWDTVDLSLSFPLTLGRWARGRLLEGQDRFAFGPGSLRLMSKAVLMKNQRWRGFGLAAVLEASVPSGHKTQYLGDDSPGFIPRIVLDYRFAGRGVVSLNLGAWLREPMRIGDLDLGSEFLVGLAAEVPLGIWSLSALADLDAAIDLTGDSPLTRRQVPIEARMGLRWVGRSGFEAVLGAGMGLSDGYGSPDVRVLVSLGYSASLRRHAARSVPVAPPNHLVREKPGSPDHAESSIHGGGSQPHQTMAGRDRAPQTPSASRPGKPDQTFPAGISDPDPDADGLAGALDRCPNQPEDRDGFEDQDGCPDPDNDHDGVPDIHDQCPNRPETINGVADEDGCPDRGKVQVVLARHRIRILQKVLFARGSDRIDPASYPLLRQVAALLKKAWWIRLVRVEGYTDNRGDEEKNVDLSIRRAYRVRAFLVQQGVAPERLIAKGYGPSHPVADNRTPAGRAKNRRVRFTIIETTAASQTKGAVR